MLYVIGLQGHGWTGKVSHNHDRVLQRRYGQYSELCSAIWQGGTIEPNAACVEANRGTTRYSSNELKQIVKLFIFIS